VAGLGIDRDGDGSVEVPPPEAGPEASALEPGPSEIAVRVSLASAERADELSAVRADSRPAVDEEAGPAPLVTRLQAGPARRPLSYTAISAHAEGGEERLVDSDRALRDAGTEDPAAEGGVARGRAVHSLLEWSHANGWREPTRELLRRISASEEVGAASGLAEEALLAPFRAWLDSAFFDERVRDAGGSRSEVPLLVEVADTVLRGSIDLLVEVPGAPPLIVDYKTDRVDGAGLPELAAGYGIQQAIYALAVAEARAAPEVELAYVFLERPEDPVVMLWGAEEIAEGRRRVEAAIARARAA
jgi:ATP-dependent exoDNAse (exonuclease V) beta subunit